MKFNKGDKVFIPTSKSNEVGFYSHEDFLEEIKDGNLSYLIISYSLSHNTYALRREDNKPLRANTFNENDLVPYVEETLPEEYVVSIDVKNGEDQQFLKVAWAKYTGKVIPHGTFQYFFFAEKAKIKANGHSFWKGAYEVLATSYGLPIIPFAKWKELYNKTNKTDMKKIIGYKAPYKVNERVPKDSIYIKYDESGYIVKGQDGKGVVFYLSKEIVENVFTPMYEEDKLYISIAGAKLEIQKNGDIKFDFNGNTGTTNIFTLQGILDETDYSLKIGSFPVTSTGIHIGCAEGINLSIDEVKSIIKQYNKFK